MKPRFELQILLRALIPLVLLPLLGIAPRAHELARSLQVVGQAGDASPAGKPAAALRAAENLAWMAAYQPWRVDLWQAAGMYALQGGHPQAAIEYFERGKRREALSGDGYLAWGDACRQSDDLRCALVAWQHALQAGADQFEIYSRYLQAHQEQGDFQAMLADLQALAALRPADVRLRYRLGLYTAAAQPEQALAHLAQAADLDPRLETQVEALMNAIRAARRADDPAYSLLEVGRALAAIGEWALAEEAFGRAADLRPDFAEAWAYLGEARQRLPSEGGEDQPPPGLEELQRALELDPEGLVANTLLALYWQRGGQFEEARQVLERMIAIYPDNQALLAELGNTLAQGGDLEFALEAYRSAVELAPGKADYWRLLAGFSVSHEYQVKEVALPAARRAAALDPQDPANLDMLGQVLLLLEDFASAERLFGRSLEADPAYALGRMHLGLIYILRDERSLARDQWVQALQVAPGTPAADQAQRLIENYFP